ncbi:MAG: histidine kinase [Leptolyngbya sp. RL_3_1]|nr:histidine kinase [Leptolyngbya sp. RL_3_1]
MSASSFKDCLGAWLTLLIEQNIVAQLWVKLPTSGVWREGLRRYSEATSPKSQIYILSHQPLPQQPWYTTVPLADDHPLKGEYGLLLLSRSASALVVAQREADSASSDTASRSQVSVTTTVSPERVRYALGEIQQLVQVAATHHPDRRDLQGVLKQWHQQFVVPQQVDPILVDSLLAQQGQRQVQLRRESKALKQQAMAATDLSTQNAALLNTLRLKDDFLNSVGQALRTPLTTIKMALPLLGSPQLKPDHRKRYLDTIRQECDRQSTLINGVLDLLQIEMSLATVVPAPIQLFDVVPGVVSTYQPIAQEKGVRLAYTVPNTLPAVTCPETWLRQIMIHLLQNSIKYTETGGEVWVTTQTPTEDWVTVTVRDTGTGIAPQDLPHIFDHFYRGRQGQEEDGAGLGLTIVQQLLLYCGGKITVESQVGQGSQFHVQLPLHRG